MQEELPFRVVWSRKAIDVLKGHGQAVAPAGSGQALAKIIEDLDRRLRTDPGTVGEVYRSRGAVVEHVAVHEFVAIDFAIDLERKLVLVRTCRVWAESGF